MENLKADMKKVISTYNSKLPQLVPIMNLLLQASMIQETETYEDYVVFLHKKYYLVDAMEQLENIITQITIPENKVKKYFQKH